MNENKYSVLVKDAVKSYGKTQILKKLCMTVETGQIYGLLGSSGCGKTTLLNTIVGRKRIESGEIWVLGGKPGDPKSGVPGAKVGYMPQETALVREFTVKDAIYYFGRIYQMDEKLIEKRYSELADLLDLPPDNRFLKDCSGGQQRRVSFAVALVHKPKLLILDEPTVGIDPLLREKIWLNLIDITKKQNLSVIITTHYIEECRQADKIGLMRNGHLLTEDSPDNLLNTFQTQTLEEVYLILSQKQESSEISSSNQSSFPTTKLDQASSYYESMSTLSVQSIPEDYKSADVLTKKNKPNLRLMNKKRMRALLDKNSKQFYRNTTSVTFHLLMPLFQVILLLYTLGLEMKNIPIGIVNDESMNTLCTDFSLNRTAIPDKAVTCHFQNLSCRFLKYHVTHPMITKIDYSSVEEAINDVKHGKIYGFMYFPKNFSESLEHRLDDGFDVPSVHIEFSTIKVRLDMSNYQIGTSVKTKLLDLYHDFQQSVFKDCKYVKGFGEIPIKTKYLYGSMDEPYQVFIIPGTIVTMMFFFGSILTSQIMITEKHEGIWDRSIIAGVTSFELTISHFLLQGFIAIFQTLEMIFFIYIIYQYDYVGNLFVMYIIVYLQALCGMSFGLLISVVCTNISMANNASMGFYLPMVIICGSLWPIEGMPNGLQIIAKILPAAIPIEALNNVVKKGLPIDSLKVASGLGISVAWILIFILLSLVLLKFQR